jgi:hypothetical protein
LDLFLVGYSLRFGVLHQPHQLNHVYVIPILTLQKVKILLDPGRERRRALALPLVLRQTVNVTLNHIRKQFHDIGMLGHEQPLRQDTGI